MTDDGEIMPLEDYPDIEVRAFADTGMITMKRGKAQAIIDTTDMTREEVVLALQVGVAQIEEQEGRVTVNRRQRRARKVTVH